MEEGFNPAVITDTLYFLDEAAKMYVPMTQDIYDAISNKTLKLWVGPRQECLVPQKTLNGLLQPFDRIQL